MTHILLFFVSIASDLTFFFHLSCFSPISYKNLKLCTVYFFCRVVSGIYVRVSRMSSKAHEKSRSPICVVGFATVFFSFMMNSQVASLLFSWFLISWKFSTSCSQFCLTPFLPLLLFGLEVEQTPLQEALNQLMRQLQR